MAQRFFCVNLFLHYMPSHIEHYQKTFSSYLQKYVRSLDKKYPRELYIPIQYILTSEAKYIRPLLCMLGCEMYGKSFRNALSAALSTELFHTFSLVHDDILDNSPLRRGKKTIHAKWNNNIAILAGDVLLVEAYKQLAQYDANTSQQLLRVFTKASIEICEGQQEDMNFEKEHSVSSAQYIEMIRKKTGVLLGTSLQMGAIIADASITEQKKIYTIGENIGIAFQIMDDYLDTFGDAKIFGKKIGSDILNNKKTFLLTQAIEKSNKNQLSRIQKALKLPSSEEKIEYIKNIYLELHIDKLVLSTVQDIHRKIIKQIQSLKNKNEKVADTLVFLSEQLIQRIK